MPLVDRNSLGGQVKEGRAEETEEMKGEQPPPWGNSDGRGHARVKFPVFLHNRAGKSGPGLGPGLFPEWADGDSALKTALSKKGK